MLQEEQILVDVVGNYASLGCSQPLTPGWARYFLNLSSFFCSFIFPQIFFIFFLILVFRVGDGKALATPLCLMTFLDLTRTSVNQIFTNCLHTQEEEVNQNDFMPIMHGTYRAILSKLASLDHQCCEFEPRYGQHVCIPG